MKDNEFDEWLKALQTGTDTQAKPPGAVRHREVQREAMEQAALFQWAFTVRQTFPELRLMYHIPNGGKRNRFEAANLKRQGVKAGGSGHLLACRPWRLSWAVHRTESRKEQDHRQAEQMAV